jgi:hypothetical protein
MAVRKKNGEKKLAGYGIFLFCGTKLALAGIVTGRFANSFACEESQRQT